MGDDYFNKFVLMNVVIGTTNLMPNFYDMFLAIVRLNSTPSMVDLKQQYIEKLMRLQHVLPKRISLQYIS